MKQEQEASGMQEKPSTSELTRARQEWMKTIILNLVIAAAISLARAAIDSLVNDYKNGYRHDARDYVQDGYPF